MLRVFVSSTSKDLQAHREAVGKALMQLEMYPVMMEDFTATDENAVEKCRSEVTTSDLFLGIYAHRYGFIPPNENKSITELEYTWAVAAKIPQLIFVVDPAYVWPEDAKDADSAPLEAFKQRVGLERVWATFTTPESLANAVLSSIAALEQDKGIEPRERIQQRRMFLAGISALMVVLILTAAVVILAAQRIAQDQANQIATNAVIVLANQTATAALWTATPTATASPTITPTPLIGATAVTQGENREVLILLATFKQISGNPLQPDEEWSFSLGRAINQMKGKVNARVIKVPTVIESHDQARAESDKYRATIVIWGDVRAADIDAYYTLTPRWSDVDVTPGQTAVEFNKLDEMRVFVGRGGDTDYVLNFVLAQLAFFGDSPRDALPYLETCIQLAPAGREAEMGLGAIYFYRGYLHDAYDHDNELALADYSMAIKLNPDGAQAYHNRGLIFSIEQQYDKALADYNNAIRINPHQINSINNRGLVFYYLGQYDKALADYDTAIHLDSTYTTTYINRGLLYQTEQQPEKALADYTTAIQLSPQDAEIYTKRAVVYDDLHRYPDALADLETALKVDPNFAEIFAVRGIVYGDMGRFEDALADFTHYTALRPDDPSGYYYLGMIYEQLQRPAEALSSYQQHLKLAGSNAQPDVKDKIAQLEAMLTPTAVSTGQP